MKEVNKLPNVGKVKKQKQKNMNKNITETPNTTVGVTQTVAVKRGPGRPKTKVTLKRVVLLNGKPVGRGRPNTDGKEDRRVVFIPVDETYDKAVHGEGTKYRAGLSQFKVPIRRVDIAKYRKLVNLPATAPAKAPEATVAPATV
jgi:hypothetical protein